MQYLHSVMDVQICRYIARYIYLDEGLGHHTGGGLGPLPRDHAQDLARAEGLQLVVDGGAGVLVDVGVVVPEYDVKKKIPT